MTTDLISISDDINKLNVSVVMEAQIKLSVILFEIANKETDRIKKLIGIRGKIEERIFCDSVINALPTEDLVGMHSTVSSAITDSKNTISQAANQFNVQELDNKIQLLRGIQNAMSKKGIGEDDLANNERASAEQIAQALLNQVKAVGNNN